MSKSKQPPKITIRPLKVLVGVELVVEHDGKFSGTYTSKNPRIIMESDLLTADLAEIASDAVRTLKKELAP